MEKGGASPFFCVRRDVGTHHGASARHIRNNFAENTNFRQKVFVFSAKSFCNIQVNRIFVYNFGVEMTEEEKELLKTFEARLRHLIYLHDEQRRENARLKELLNACRADCAASQAAYRALEKRYTDLKTATTISLNGSDVKETKLRLSKLVREVDKCIALLNE